MAALATPDGITRLVRQCDPNEVLEPGDPRFVDFNAARGTDDVHNVERRLRRAGEQPQRVLFAGHLGIGKSSLLKRLQAELEQEKNGQPPFEVVWVDASSQLDPNDLDFPELMVLIAAETQQRFAQSGYGFRLAQMGKDLWSFLGRWLHPASAEVELPLGKLTVEFRNQPNARAKLREAIENRATDLVSAFNQLVEDASAHLRQQGKAGLAIIVDGLEKISRRDLPNGSNTHDRLFIDRSADLAGLAGNYVYTVPISLFYSPQCAVLEQAFGQFNAPVPMVKIRPSQDKPVMALTEGMKCLRELLDKRCQAAAVSLEEAFDPNVVERLCEMSGGHPRHLLMLVRTAADRLDSLPITMEAAEAAVATYANSLLREIPNGFWPLLRRFDFPQDDISRDDDHQKMLYYLHVFEYQNGRPWYEVNPVLRALERFRRA